MKLLATVCNGCGAPLEVPKGTRSVRCGYCNTHLRIEDRHTETMADDRADASTLEKIRQQNDLERLDREWMMQRQNFMVKGKDGEMSLPGKAHLFGTGFVVLFGLFWTVFAGAIFPPMALFGIIFVGFAIFQGIHVQKKLNDYTEAHRFYRRSRQQILQDLDVNDAPGINDYLKDLSK